MRAPLPTTLLRRPLSAKSMQDPLLTAGKGSATSTNNGPEDVQSPDTTTTHRASIAPRTIDELEVVVSSLTEQLAALSSLIAEARSKTAENDS